MVVMSVELIDWAKIEPISMVLFLERFTLHDSDYVRMTAGDGDVVLDMWFDLIWNQMVPGEYGRLLIRFECVYVLKCVTGNWDQTTIGDALATVLSESEREKMLESSDFELGAYGSELNREHPTFDESLTRTEITMINNCVIELLHGGAVRAVVMNDKGGYLDVAGLAG